jgi:hypothetical protein
VIVAFVFACEFWIIHKDLRLVGNRARDISREISAIQTEIDILNNLNPEQ